MNFSEEYMKIENAQTKLALEKFEEYKKYIAQELVNNCNDSYMTVAKMGNNWQETFKCNSEYVKSLKESTKRFLYTFPADDLNYCSHCFFERLVREICIYIAPYVHRLNTNYNSLSMTDNALFVELFTSNEFVKKQIERYNQKYTYKIEQQRIAEREAAAASQKRTRKRIGEKIEISVVAEQISKIDAQKFEQQIKKRRKKIKCQAIREKHKQQMEQAVLAQISVISK